jgi:DNA-binding beta-propeller fold protein YncE
MKQRSYFQFSGTATFLLLLAMLASTAFGATFGKVVPIGGQASDIALDEARGVLYIANFTANRIDVMSLADYSIQTSINVGTQPSSLALSPDGQYLVVAHFGNFAPPLAPANALSVINLNSASRLESTIRRWS